jgi:hypothetical protein
MEIETFEWLLGESYHWRWLMSEAEWRRGTGLLISAGMPEIEDLCDSAKGVRSNADEVR